MKQVMKDVDMTIEIKETDTHIHMATRNPYGYIIKHSTTKGKHDVRLNEYCFSELMRDYEEFKEFKGVKE